MLFPPKVTQTKLDEAITSCLAAYSDRKLVVLLDLPLETPAVRSVDCRSASLEAFLFEDFAHTLFVYACDSEAIGAPFIDTIISNSGLFIPVHIATPSLYININDTARKVLEQEFEDQVREGFAKWSFGPSDFINLIQAIDRTAHLEGDYVEIGCYRGSSGCAVLRYMREIRMRRRCYFFDVFDGFNYAEAKRSADRFWLETHKTEGIEIVDQRLKKYQDLTCGPSVFTVKSNIITNSLPTEIDRIVVANLDVDMFEAICAALDKVAPRIVPGGIMVVEDPGHTPLLIGARVALNRFLASPGAAAFYPIYLDSGQTFMIRMPDRNWA